MLAAPQSQLERAAPSDAGIIDEVIKAATFVLSLVPINLRVEVVDEGFDSLDETLSIEIVNDIVAITLRAGRMDFKKPFGFENSVK